MPAEAKTPKGQRGRERGLRAAATVLARDGYGGATLRRIADEAGVDKRNLQYYFGTREALLARVVQTVGEEAATNIDALLHPEADVRATIDLSVDAFWAGITSDPELARAYFALIGGGAGTPEIEDALRELKRTYAELVKRMVTVIESTGAVVSDDLDGLVTVVLATLRGLLLEWSETGDDALAHAGLIQLKALLALRFSS